MDFNPFALLKEKIDQLIQFNIELRKQKEIYAEKLRLKEVEIERFQRQCRNCEIKKEEAKNKIDRLINKLREIGIG